MSTSSLSDSSDFSSDEELFTPSSLVYRPKCSRYDMGEKVHGLELDLAGDGNVSTLAYELGLWDFVILFLLPFGYIHTSL